MQTIEMEAKVTDDYELHLKLPDIPVGSNVQVIVMYHDDSPAKISDKRKFGQFKGLIQIGDDFDEALPGEFWTGRHGINDSCDTRHKDPSIRH